MSQFTVETLALFIVDSFLFVRVNSVFLCVMYVGVCMPTMSNMKY